MKAYLKRYTGQLIEALENVDIYSVHQGKIHGPGWLDDDALFDLVKNEIETALCLAFPIFTFGNGGSAAVAEHIVADLVKCVGHDTGLNPFVMNLASNAPLMTCIANDYHYNYVFARQLAWYQQPGAIAIGISSSGSSPNIVEAFKAAKNNRMKTIAFVGFDGGRMLTEKLSDTIIHVKASNYGIVEDAHMAILHAIIQKIRITNCENPEKIKL